MTERTEAMLPHESVCPLCDGYNPALGVCPTCDGTGVVVNERRKGMRHDDSMAAEFTRLRNLVAEQHAKILAQEELMLLTIQTIDTVTTFLQEATKEATRD